MNRFIICIFSLFVLIFANLFAQDAESVMTLDESINCGLHNNQELLALQEQISLSQQRISEAMAQIYPKIDFNLSTSQFNNDTPIVLSPSFNSVYLPDNKADLFYSTRFSLWQYLYAGGRHTTTVRLAEINLSHAKSQADIVKNKIVRDVKKIFYFCVQSQEIIKVYEAALKDSRDPKEAIRLKYELVRIKYEYDKQKLEFLNTTGLELNTFFVIKGELKEPAEQYDLNKCLAWAFQYRPELQQTQFQETIDSLRVHLSLTERYPTITLGANYEWAGDKFPLSQTNWNATINLNVPVFDGWASWSRVKQRKFQAREGKIRRARIEDQIRYEVRDAYMDYDFWRNQMVLLNTDISNPANADKKIETKIFYLQTILKYLNSCAALDWAIGKPFFK